jgi:hypothetical protein
VHDRARQQGGARSLGRSAPLPRPLSWQRAVGNRALAQAVQRAKGCGCPGCKSIGIAIGRGDVQQVDGEATATYAAGSYSGPNRLPQGGGTFRAAGTMRMTYPTPAVSISHTPLPPRLSPCERRAYQAAWTNVLLPHEQEHKRRFQERGTPKSFAGAVEVQVENVGTNAEITAAERELLNDTGHERADTNRAYATEIDPFSFEVDTSPCSH